MTPIYFDDDVLPRVLAMVAADDRGDYAGRNVLIAELTTPDAARDHFLVALKLVVLALKRTLPTLEEREQFYRGALSDLLADNE